MIKRKFCLLFILLALTTAKMQAQYFFVHNFSNEDYNGGTQNWDIGFGKDECIYFANNFGLMIYDGSTWEMNQVKNYTSVRTILPEKESNHIYVGASEEFGYFHFNAKNYRAEYVSLSDKLPKKDRKFTEVWNIFKWQGMIVFQSHNYLFFYKDDKFIKTIKFADRIESAAVINNRLYVISRKDLIVFDKINKSSKTALDDKIANSTIRAIVPFKKYILICSPDKGMVLFDGINFHRYTTQIDKQLYEDKIFSFALKDDVMAIGTVRNGLYLYNTKNGSYHHINVNSGLQNNTVLNIAFDKNGNLWLGLDNGITFLQNHSSYQQLIPHGYSIGTGCASIFYKDRLYLGTNQGLFFTNTTNNVDSFGAPTLIKSIKGQVWTFCNDNGVLLCGADDGAYVVKGNYATKIEGTDGTWKICVLTKHPGFVIGSDYNGLYILKQVGNGYVVYSRINNNDLASNSILEDKDGSIWICHWQKGVYHIILSEDLTKPKSITRYHKGNGLLVDNDNSIALINGKVTVSSVDGIRIFNAKTNKLEMDNRLTKMFDTYGNALQLYQNANGDIWGFKPSYIAIAHKKTDISGRTNYDIDKKSFLNITGKLQFGLGNTSDINSRYTLFTGKEGYYLVDNKYKSVDENSNVYIRKIFSTNKNDSLFYNYHLKGENKNITIPYKNNSLRIEFVMPDYQSAENVVYSCYLENYDKEWSTYQKAHFKEYTHLSKGKYIFHVKARNLINGVEKEDCISFEIETAWYETNIAYFVYFLLVIATIYGIALIIRRRNQQALQRERDKQQQQIIEMKSQNLEMQLRLKSHELASSTMSLVRKNDILLDIDEEMAKLSESVRREEPKAELTHRISNIRKNLKKNINNDENWDKFEESFDLIYDKMMKRLCKEYPSLKLSDRRLCAYLRMGLNSKEMASLMNTTTRSIETARYRLRKKLNLNPGENLTDFIVNY